jgi:hypothetical protein
MTRLELDLMEYIHTREAVCDFEIARYGVAGADRADAERRGLADLRAIMDGDPLPGPGAE